MSSSSDESEEKQPQQTGAGSDQPVQAKASVVWDKSARHQLCQGVMAQLDPSNSLVPFDQVKIDWSKVSVEGVSSEKCATKWALMVNQVRHYRTLSEIAADVMLMNRTENTELAKWNKMEKVSKQSGTIRKAVVKKEKNDYPPKPKSNGYSLYSTEILRQGVNGQGPKVSMKEIGEKWKLVSPEEKQMYTKRVLQEKEEYLLQLELYAKEHPEDKVIVEMISEEKRRKEGKSKRKMTGTKIMAGLQTITEWATAAGQKNQSNNATLNATILSDSDDSEKSPKKKPTTLETPITVAASPKKRKHEEVKEVQSPSKKHKHEAVQEVQSPSKKQKHEDVLDTPKKSKKNKKAKKHQKKSGEDMFEEKKFEEYRLTHPDLAADDIKTKLRKKFEKLNNHKQEKYRKMAQEWNENH